MPFQKQKEKKKKILSIERYVPFSIIIFLSNSVLILPAKINFCRKYGKHNLSIYPSTVLMTGGKNARFF